MVTASPIVICSSSPPIAHVESTTPPSFQPKNLSRSSSSACLPSPTSFSQARSKSQGTSATPSITVHHGFTAAAKKWRADQAATAHAKTTTTASNAAGVDHSIGKFERRDGDHLVGKVTDDSRGAHLEDTGIAGGKDGKVTAATSLSVNVAAALDELPQIDGGLEGKATKPPKAARKLKAGSKTNGTITARVRKPRKPIKKSESIILNSDDPGDVVIALTEPLTIACEDSGIFIANPELPTPNAHELSGPTSLPGQSREAAREQVNTTLTSDVACDEVSIHFQKRSSGRKSSPACPGRNLDKAQSADPVQSESILGNFNARATEAAASCSDRQSRSLSATIEGLCYVVDNGDVAAIHRTETGESLPKRRRMNLGAENAPEHGTDQPNDETNPETLAEAQPAKKAKKAKADKSEKSVKAPAAPKVKKAKAEKAAKPPKPPKPPKTPKPKKPKTKARTITDLVTSAYRPVAEGVIETSTVSAFFTPRQEIAKPDISNEPGTAQAGEPAKVKTPRVPHVQIIDPHQTVARKPKAGSAVKPKKRKSKVKINEDDHMPELLIPELARAKEKSQRFLFGTSSQLAAEESPTFIRDMQLAIEYSEAFLPLAAHTSRTGTLLERIRDASHSPQKTRSGLWREAARDRAGGLQTCGRRRRVKGSFDPHPSVLVTKPDERHETHPPVQLAIPSPQLNRPEEATLESGLALSEAGGKVNEDAANLVAPRSDILAAAHKSGRGALNEPAHPDAVDLSAPIVEPASPVHHHSPPVSDDWMLLSSDTIVEDEASVAKETMPTRSYAAKEQPQASSRAQQKPCPPSQNTGARPVVETQNLTSLPRAPLRTLDRNISPAKMAVVEGGIEKQRGQTKAKDLETTKPSSAPMTKPRGRPRKDEASTTPKTRKTKLQERAGAARPEPELLARLPTALSQPERTVSSQWMAIDEISDSDTPATPSPPRIRRAVSSPPAIRPLPLSLPSSPAKVAIPILLHPILNIADAAWPGVRETLFPKITRLVKSTPPSTEMNLPTWHEKMLLYDPIVLEDLTTWLTEQGLRFELRRPTTKAKTKVTAKSRKKTSDAVAETGEGEVSAPEFAIVREEVKPWMVQRWCEEKSICCLWKEGLRGGVKVKY